MAQTSFQILIYGNRKAEDVFWDISTPELRAAAFLDLFKYLDEVWSVYLDLDEQPEAEVEGYPPDHVKGCKCGRCFKLDSPEEKRRQESSAKRQKEQKDLYIKAKAGDAKAAERLLSSRKDSEYEEWSIGEVIRAA